MQSEADAAHTTQKARERGLQDEVASVMMMLQDKVRLLPMPSVRCPQFIPHVALVQSLVQPRTRTPCGSGSRTARVLNQIEHTTCLVAW